jgi:predicted ATPase/DNA-binding SARP family transcriptional activator
VGPTLSINLLGSPTIALDGRAVKGFVSSKAAALVYYLAATGRPHTREALAGLLWSETTDAQAFKNLRDVLSNLRRLLAPYLEITRQTVELIAETSGLVDSRRFEAYQAAAERVASDADAAVSLRKAVALYQGDFLEGFAVGDAPAFEAWALAERERLRQLLLNGLYRLTAVAAAQGAYLDGIAHASRLLALDPTREEAHRQLMLLLALSGQRGAALAQYEACRRVLNEDLGLDPDAETEALHKRILNGEELRIANEELRKPNRHAATFSMLNAQFSIPSPLGTFVGRAAELAQLIEWLRDPDCRLVTIVGMGGAGKTRLALHTARQLMAASRQGQAFAHGIAFVPLTSVEASVWGEFPVAQVLFPVLAACVADALSCLFSGPEAPHIQLINYLREKDLLLVLDNCEHLPAVDTFITELLEQAPGCTILATSRSRLNVRGERVIELMGLPFPNRRPTTDDRRPTTVDKEPRSQEANEVLNPHLSASRSPSLPAPSVIGGQPSAVDLEQYSALDLFRHSAQAVSAHFAWTPVNAAAATRICALVDGLPLGIELAASLVRVLPCEEIARELAANISFLHSTRRDLPERHQSLRAVFDHSWKLLSAAEQRALRQLAVFHGGFTREAAAAVVKLRMENEALRNGHPDQTILHTSFSILHLLTSLLDKSLVRQSAGRDEAVGRYELLDLVRQYAAEHLAAQRQNDEEPWAVQDRHSRYYLAFLRARTLDLRGQRQQAALAEIHQELENIHAAWRWAVDHGDATNVGAGADSLFHFFEMRSRFAEGAEVFGQAAARFAGHQGGQPDPQSQLVRGKLLARQGWFTFQIGRQFEARALLEQSLAILRALEATDELAFPLNYLASVMYHAGNYAEANQLVEEALAVSLARGDRHATAIAKTILGQIAYLVGRYEDARRHSQESLFIERELGNRWGTVYTLISLGRVAQALGDYRAARRSFQEGLAIRQALGDARGVALCLNFLGDTAAALAEQDEARRCYQQSLELFREIGNQSGAAASLTRLGYNALAMGERFAAGDSFRDALRTAWHTQTIPHTLEALAGIATLLAASEPGRAHELSVLILGHPAATQESRDRAEHVLARLAPQPSESRASADQQREAPPLDVVVAAILGEP